MDKFESSPEEENWRQYMRIRINETDTNANKPVYTEISKPPKALVDVKPESYRPQILTIGPLHEMLSGSSSLYDCKALCVNKFIKGHEISDVDELMQRLRYDPSDLQSHYSGLPKYSSESLQLLVTVDTIFFREFLPFLQTEWESEPEEDRHFYTLCNNSITFNQAVRDLFVMGNQIPMSFLVKLIEEFPKKVESEDEGDELHDGLLYAVEITDPFYISKNLSRAEIAQIFETPEFVNCTHLLDCLYLWVVRERVQKNGSSNAINPCKFPQLWNPFHTEQAAHKITIYRDRLPTASQLSKAGIRFKAIEGSISVMHYDKSSLRFDLPRLVVYNKTEDVLRNLLAHEQTCTDDGEFTKYVSIMDSLIDTPEDVAILTKAQVIENHLGSDEKLLKMWNDMCTNIDIRACERWETLIEDVLHHYESPWRPVYVEFREKYFSRPWVTISLLVAFLLLLFALVQTGYTVAGYYHSQP